jgi:hypothetical protein
LSRVYFHTPTAQAELAGAERAWLRHLADGPASNAWDIEGPLAYDHAKHILAMAPERPEGEFGGNYLHRYLAEAENAVSGTGRNYQLNNRLVSALQTSMRVGGLELRIHGITLHTIDLGANAALIAGSDPVALAAKIHYWCEAHCWVEGPDRAWFADIVEQGLSAGVYRRGMGWDAPGQYDNGPGVVPLLRERDDEPVVLSFSGSDQFPNEMVGDWMPPWPPGVPKEWNALSESQKHQRSERQEDWHELSDEERWDISMRGLRDTRSSVRLSAETLRGEFFGVPLTAYDVMDPHRADHVREVLAREPGFLEEVQHA